jgi:hypothetical protein
VRIRAAAVLLLGAALVVLAPLAGLAAAGIPLAPYLAFPPRTVPGNAAPFDWGAFAFFCLPVAACAVLYGVALSRASPVSGACRSQPYPWWGWAGLALAALGWALAWTDGLVAPQWRRHTFTLLWTGYIVVLNALAWRRAGRSLLTHRPRLFAALFPASIAFWWLFEYLNQFARNWYYTGIESAGDWDYFLQASLPFSTVLPAVASTWYWLAHLPRLAALSLPRMEVPGAISWLALAAGALALAAIGLWPQFLYPALWLAPPALLAGLQQMLLGETLFSRLRHADWRAVLQPALAALLCGVFWEMWNYGSLAKWHYSVPLVNRFHVFEMPLLGYAGYLPFGVTCAVVTDLVARAVEARALSPLARD